MSGKPSIDHESTKERIITDSRSEDSEQQKYSSDNDLLLSLKEKNEKVSQLAEEYNINHKKLMWKIDLCVVPPFCLLYFLAF